MTIDISIIIPIYKVEDYLRDCLQSIVMQDFKGNYEVILINDCSPDGCESICTEFTANYPNIFKYHKFERNLGVSESRNHGLELSQGKYFTFVDPDDLLPRNCLTSLFCAAEKYDADIVKGNNKIFRQDEQWDAPYSTPDIKEFNDEEVLATLYEHKYIRGHIWGKLFNREKFCHIKSEPGVAMAQDLLFMCELFSQANKLVIINELVYHYRLRKTGSTGKKFETKAYIWWLYSVERVGRFSSTPIQVRRHKQLQIRTLLQLIREARFIEAKFLAPVLSEIELRLKNWNLSLYAVSFTHRLSAASIFRYIKFLIIFNRLQKRVTSI